MNVEATVRAYYDALRDGEALTPFFSEAATAKFGINEALFGHEAIAKGLREQTETTGEWSVESRDLRVTERECYAWMADRVRMAWTETETGKRRTHDTRWSATLERAGENDTEEGDHEWRFLTMHVSVPTDLGDDTNGPNGSEASVR